MAKMTKFEITNFQAFKKAVIEFDEQNIINIKGYNSTGKSAILRALNVFYTFAWTKEWTDFIHFNEPYFELKGTFEDDTVITMTKQRGGKVTYTLTNKGKVLYTTESTENTAAWSAKAIPNVIAQYLNVLGGSTNIHYQRSREPLMLIDTSPAQTYRDISTILQSDIGVKALNYGKGELNQARANFKEADSVVGFTLGKLQGLEYLTDEVVETFDKLYNNYSTTSTLLTQLEGYKGYLQRLQELRVLSSLPPIAQLDTTNLAILQNYKQLLIQLDELKLVSHLSTIQGQISSLQEQINSKMSQIGVLQDVHQKYISKKAFKGIISIDSQSINKEFTKLENVQNSLNFLTNMRDYVSKSDVVTQSIQKLQVTKQEYLTQYNALVKKGDKLFRCPHCSQLMTLEEVEYHVQ